MEIFFTEEYDGPDCGKDSGLKIYMTLSVGTRSNNEKYVLVQVYRRNPECQNNRGFAVGLPGSINISLNLNTDENPYDNYLLHLISENRIAEDHWLILFVRRLAELLACTQHRKGRLSIGVLSETDNTAIIRNSIQMIEPGQVGLTAALVSTIALTDVFNSLEDIERFAKATGVIDVMSPVSTEESEYCKPKFSSVHSIAQSILTYTSPDTPENLKRENLESLFENNLSSTPTEDNDIRNEMLLDQIIRKTPQGQFLRAGHATGGNGFIKIPNHFFVFKPFFLFTMKPKNSKKVPEHDHTALHKAFSFVRTEDLLKVSPHKYETVLQSLLILARSYFLVLASSRNNEEINEARKHIKSHEQQALDEHRRMCSTSNTESSDSGLDDITRCISEEVVCSVLITAYLLDKKSGTNRNLLDKSVAMTQDSIRRVRGLRFQHSINLGAVVLHRFLSEVLPGRSLDVSSRQQVSAEPVLKMLRKEQTDSAENRETVLQDL
jgi:hypothetical protein